MNKTIVIAAALLASVPQAQAFWVMGSGAATCGAFVNSSNDLQAHAMGWVLGWLTRGNMQWTQGNKITKTGNSETDILIGLDYDAMKVWISNYCRANPLKKINEAALALEGALLKRLMGE